MTTTIPPRLDLAALQRLQQISVAILGELDLDRLLESILRGAASLLDASQVNLYRHLPEADLVETWIPLAAPDGVSRIQLRRGEGAAGVVLAEGQAIKIDDYDRWADRTPQWPSGFTGPTMAVPVQRGQDLLGVITVGRRPDDPLFTIPDLELFQLFANQAAVAITNAQLFAEAGRRAEERSKLYDTSLDMVGQLDLAAVLQATLERAADLLDASQTHLYRYLPDRDILATWIPLRVPEGFAVLELARGEGLAGTVLAAGRGMRLADYDAWEGRTLKWPTGVTGPSLAVPIRRRDSWLGVITAGRPHGAPLFTDEDLDLLQLFANQAAVAIANAQLFAEATRRAEELTRLHDTSLDVVNQLDLPSVLEAALARATGLLDAQSANLRLYDPDRDLLVPLHPFRQPEAIARHALRPGEGLSGQVFATGQSAFINDYDRWQGRSRQYPTGVIHRAMGAPLREGDRIIGVLVIERAADSSPFGDDDIQLLNLFANQVSIAITNSHQVEQLRQLHRQQIEKERLDQQLRMAQAVQAGLLPAEPPRIPGWDSAATWRPALQLGGDYYDFIPLDQDRWAILMADVSDKGVAAALLMAVARTLFRAHASADLPPSQTLARVNHDLVASSHSGMFVTAVYAIADTRSGAVRLAAAGHPPALVLRHPKRRVDAVRPGGMPLGILEEATFGEQEIELGPRQALVLYTDGLTEASNPDGEQFGADRLDAFLRRARSAPARDLIASLDQEVRAFVGDTPVSDDVAYLVLRREG